MTRVRHLTTALVALTFMTGTAYAQTDPAELLKAARAAVGGAKLDQVTGLTLAGEFRRTMGQRGEIDGDLTIDLLLPDKIKRTEEMGFQGGPRVERVSVLNSGEFWDDTTTRGGGGGNFMARMNPEATDADRARFREMQQRRMQGELTRTLLIFLLRTEAPLSYGGVAEASDGSADVIDVKPEGAPPMQLFLDQKTHLPLMLTYKGFMPRFFMRRGPGAPGSGASQPGQAGAPATGTGSSTGTAPQAGNAPPQGGAPQGGAPSPEEMRRRMAEPPQEVTFELRVSDYKEEGGVNLPHTLSIAVNGNATEEWTISQVKVNPKLKPEAFVKK